MEPEQTNIPEAAPPLDDRHLGSKSSTEKSLQQSQDPPHTTQGKPTWKERLLHEVREVLCMVLYLAVSLSLVATFRSLVLIQTGINDFAHSYIVAIVLSLALGKIVAIAQKFRFISAWNHRPLVQSVLYKSVLMTIIMNVAGKAEERMFPHLNHGGEPVIHHLALLITHQIALMCIFIVLFTWRDLDRVLGHGTLFRLFFFPRELERAKGSGSP